MKSLSTILFFLYTIATLSQTWSLELRPTLHFSTKEVLERPLRIGNGIELSGIYSVGKRTDLYAGVIWNRFDTDDDFPEVNIEFIQKGFVAGGMVYFAFTQTQKYPFYIRAGLSFMTVESESEQSSFNITTSTAVGSHMGIGMKIISLDKWHLVPEIRYGNSSHRYQVDGVNRYLTFSTVSITAAIRKNF